MASLHSPIWSHGWEGTTGNEPAKSWLLQVETVTATSGRVTQTWLNVNINTSIFKDFTPVNRALEIGIKLKLCLAPLFRVQSDTGPTENFCVVEQIHPVQSFKLETSICALWILRDVTQFKAVVWKWIIRPQHSVWYLIQVLRLNINLIN